MHGLRIKENCGVFGIYSPDNCGGYIRYGIHSLQQRGEEYSGIATYNGDLQSTVHRGWVESAFTEEEPRNLEGNFGIGHVSSRDPQPIVLESKIGKFAIAYSGNIINSAELREHLQERGHSFSTHTDIELIAKLIAQGRDFVEGIEKMSKQIEGSYSLVILAKEGVYVARDPYAFKPLILGERDGNYAAASESSAFRNLPLAIRRDVEPGEIILLNKHGFKTLKKLTSRRKAHCAFEWAYIGNIDSIIDGIPVVRVRNNLGRALARKDNLEADLVGPVPLSGIAHAQGYHEESGIPYKEVFLLDRYLGRSYTPPQEKVRAMIAKRKLSTIEENIKGKRIILVDDSIVRGTQIRGKVKELKNAGAREVHVRVACPPLRAPCGYDVSTRSYEELIANKLTLDKIRKFIEADSLRYNTLEDFIKAIGLPKKDLCLTCWTGQYPTN